MIFHSSQKGKTDALLAFLEQQISTRAAVSYVLEVAAKVVSCSERGSHWGDLVLLLIYSFWRFLKID